MPALHILQVGALVAGSGTGWNPSVMPPSVESLVQSQHAAQSTDRSSRNRNSSGGVHTRPVGRRRFFVQTDTGNVLGIELDRSDNVQTVKKRMQALLHVPMEQAALICGDTVLKSDLSKVKNDTPLLLTRGLQRSLSTPCLSPTSEFQMQVDEDHPLEVVGGLMCCSNMRMIIREIVKAIKCGVEPVPVSGGLGGAYYFRNSRGESVAIVKPTDEEPLAPNNPKGFVGRMLGQPGLKRSVRVGETGVREVAAYLLDYDNFAKVPPTVLVKISHHVFHINSATSGFGVSGKSCAPVAKIASCQQFVHHDFDASDHGSSRFSVSAVHRIGILDIRIFNTDRHAGNILVKKIEAFDKQGAWGRSITHVNDSLELIPIDHGLCLPEALEDPYFEWLHWPQASVPFSEEELDYIRRLDVKKDVDMLQAELPMLREASLRMLILSTTFLQKAAAAGFCLAEVGGLMSRDGMEESSQLELLCLEAKQQVESKLSGTMLDDDDYFSEASSGGDELPEQFEFEMDKEESKFGEDGDRNTAFSNRVKYLDFHLAGLKESSGLLIPKDAHKEKVPALTIPCIYLSSSKMDGKKLNSSFSNASLVIKLGNESSSLQHPASSPRYVRAEPSPLKALCEASSLEEEDFFLNSPAKQRTSFMNGGRVVSRAISFRNSSDRSSIRITEADCSLGSTYGLSCLKDEVSELAGNMASWKITGAPARAMSYRSASLSDRKQRCSNYPERRTFGLPGVSASETLGKAKVAGSATAFSLGEMSEEEWRCFMEFFQELLQEAFAARCSEHAGYRQRLGISCQF